MLNTRYSLFTVAGLTLLAASIAIGGRAYGQHPGQQTSVSEASELERIILEKLENEDRGKFEKEDCEKSEKEDREKLGKKDRPPLSCRAKAKLKRPGTPAQAIFTPNPPPTPPGTTIEKANGPPPPVPQGPFVPGRGNPIPFTHGAIVNPLPSSPSPDPPGDFHFFVNNGLSVPSASFSSVDEPSVASHDDTPGANKAILYTGNWYAAVSTDNGTSFKYMNPFKLGDEAVPPGGFCCDQQVLYEPSRDLYFWLRQYSTTGGCDNLSPPNCTGNNVYRIDVAHGADAVANGRWCYYDFTPQDLGMPAGRQLDYPHVALSDNFFYFSANAYLTRSVAGTDWRGTSIARIPLDPLVNCDGYTYFYLTVTDHYDFNLAHGATNTIYWASLNSGSSIRIYKWAEDSVLIPPRDVSVSSWNQGSSPCPDPNSVDWCSARGGVGGSSGTGWSNGNLDNDGAPTVGFMWNAAACTNPSQCAFNRPWPYIRAVRFNQSTLSEIDEPDIWNASYAFQFPGVNVNARGHLGGAMFWGGGSYFPTLVALIWDDFSCNPFNCGWENYGAVGSSRSNNNWGDNLNSRPDSPFSNTWVATGFSYDGTNVTPQFMWFGRERDTPE